MHGELYPRYEAKPLKDGKSWYVVLSRNGIVEKLYGFDDEAQAKAWIIKDLSVRAFRSQNPDRMIKKGAPATKK